MKTRKQHLKNIINGKQELQTQFAKKIQLLPHRKVVGAVLKILKRSIKNLCRLTDFRRYSKSAFSKCFTNLNKNKNNKTFFKNNRKLTDFLSFAPFKILYINITINNKLQKIPLFFRI